jgi:hypothetical protein
MLPSPLFPDPKDKNYVEYPEAWIVFGPFARDVYIAHGAIEAPPRDAKGKIKDARVFGWMNDSARRIELGPFGLGYGHTRRTLGIDYATLSGTSKEKGSMPYAGRVIFHGMPHERNVNGPDVYGLESGELDFGSRGTTVEAIVDESHLSPEQRTVEATKIIVADSAPEWDQIEPGVSVQYQSGTSKMYRSKTRDGQKRYGTVAVDKNG